MCSQYLGLGGRTTYTSEGRYSAGGAGSEGLRSDIEKCNAAVLGGDDGCGGASRTDGSGRHCPGTAVLTYSIDCSSLPGLKRTALPGGIETSAPVRGFRPIPVLRGRTLNTPKPRNSMRSPVESAFFMLSKTVSTASSALVLVIPVRLTTSLMMSSLITRRLPSSENWSVSSY